MRHRTARSVLALLAVGAALAATLVGLAPTSVGAGEAPTQTFSDVPPSHPFYEEIEWAAANGYTTGYPDGTFRGTQSVSKEAFAAFVWRAAGQPDPAACPSEGTCWQDWCTFSDVSGSAFVDALRWTMSVGGVDCQWFVPQGPRPYHPGHAQARDRAARVLMTGLDLGYDGDPPPTFADVPISNANYGWVEEAANLGITNGYADGLYHPRNPVSRQAAIAFLYRAMHLTS
ncbi:hypothetical protein B7486_58490 [cyanobacterium TDX16]|nr:hypothetical protein B7486_58490 [cyanobacterium TDX16]